MEYEIILQVNEGDEDGRWVSDEAVSSEQCLRRKNKQLGPFNNCQLKIVLCVSLTVLGSNGPQVVGLQSSYYKKVTVVHYNYILKYVI